MKNLQLETLAVHAGVEPDPTTGAVMTPIYQTSTYAQTDIAQHKGYEYSRTDNPTRSALQTALAALEGGSHALAFASGMATIDTVLRLIKPGEHVLSGNDVYGGTYRLFDKILSGYGIEFDFVELTDKKAVAAAIKPNTKLVWLETPTNPLLKLADIQAIADIALDTGVFCIFQCSAIWQIALRTRENFKIRQTPVLQRMTGWMS
jgi:cystathionine beta-lyase/cystathionine gamma-synthase